MANPVTWDRVSDMLDRIRQTGIAESLSLVGSIGWDVVFVLMAGGLLIALPSGLGSYIVSLRYFVKRRDAAAQTPA